MKITTTQFNIISAGVLLFVTATANARLMLIVSVVGLFIGLNFLRIDRDQSGVLAVTIGFFFVLIMALVIWLRK
ncbi:MAG TPA: hypothetical protein DDW50_00485 [Firmicutes bacterium]|jgi:hypothetical protein|nr:hypothetical protein [Bacillota bacterium]